MTYAQRAMAVSLLRGQEQGNNRFSYQGNNYERVAQASFKQRETSVF